MDTHVVAIPGSLRERSYTRLASQRALNAAEARGATTELIDIRELDLPVYDGDAAEAGDANDLACRVRRADAILLATPVYHGSYSAPLKNALDYCGFDEFEHTTVGLLAVAGGSFPTSALEHLRSVCRALNAWVLPHQAALPRVSSQFRDGELVDERMADRVDTLGVRLVEYADIQPDPMTVEACENVGADD
jgi:NAD(P)H-dependent FMN reductase